MNRAPLPTSPRAFAEQVVRRLREEGYCAYFAGGCVRDQQLGIPPKDFDVATSARPEQVRAVFGKRRTLPIGASFGVITVLGPKGLAPIEVATFRTDGTYSDGRRPDRVDYSTAEEDAQRRDFTINGMFFDPLTAEVIDFVGGQEDLARGCIRAIGRAEDRIVEDRLRMLRAVRIAANYNFTLESATFAAIQTHAAEIQGMSQERISAELTRMLTHANRSLALELLAETTLLPYVLPPLAAFPLDAPRWPRLRQRTAALDTRHLEAVLAVLFGPPGAALAPAEASQRCRQMKLSNQVARGVAFVLQHQATLAAAHRLPFSQLQPLLDHADFETALHVLRAEQAVAPQEDLRLGLARCEQLQGLPAAERNPQPLLDGHALAELGIPAGPLYGKLLTRIRAEQLDGLLSTPAQARARARELADES